MPIKKSLLKTMAFSNHIYYDKTVSQTSDNEETTSEATIAYLFSYCRKAGMIELDKFFNRSGQIGSPDRGIEVDETKIRKRK